MHHKDIMKIASGVDNSGGDGGHQDKLIHGKDNQVEAMKDNINKSDFNDWIFKLGLHLEEFPDWSDASLVLQRIQTGKIEIIEKVFDDIFKEVDTTIDANVDDEYDDYDFDTMAWSN